MMLSNADAVTTSDTSEMHVLILEIVRTLDVVTVAGYVIQQVLCVIVVPLRRRRRHLRISCGLCRLQSTPIQGAHV